MADITITLTEEKLARLREKASSYGVSPEELAHACIDHLIGDSEGEFEKAVDYVLKKNEELYRRLA
jgi:antitoxin FitA